MAVYGSAAEQIARSAAGYPDLAPSLRTHDLQPLRIAATAKHIRSGDVVLDVGCNTGYLAEALPWATVHGVDVNHELVAEARKRMASAHVCPAERLPFPDRAFDVVNVSGLLEIVYDPRAVLAEAARVTSRAITGTTCHADGAWGRSRVPTHPWHTRSFDAEEIAALLAGAGSIEELTVIYAPGIPEPQCWAWLVAVQTDKTGEAR